MTILNKEKILEAAKAFIDEGKLDKAIREYEKILLADPTDLKVKLRVAELYTKRKQINEAIRIYREVAGAYTAEGFLLKAVTVFKNILRLNPSLIEVNEELAQLYERMGLVSDAVRQYDILASTLDMRGMGERVVEVRKKIVSLNPKDGSARIRLAELFQREGMTDEAIDQYEQYARQVETEGGKRSKLADLYEKILAHRPGNKELIRKLIDIYEEIGDHKKALKWLEAAREMVEGDPKLLKLAASIYSSQNQTETARMKYMQLAELESKAGNKEAALTAYFEILVMLPDEEDRLEPRVEELAPGAMAGLIERATLRRKDLEEEELRRQEEAEGGEEQKADQGDAKVEERAKAKEELAPKAEPKVEKKAEAKAEKKEPVAEVPASPPSPAPEPVPEKVDKTKGDRAFDLGTTYRKMGLRAESDRELKKALDIYKAFVAGGGDADSVSERISSIEECISRSEPKGSGAREKPSPQPAKGQPAKPEGELKKKAPTKPKKAEEKKEEKGKKKRISFV